MTTKYYIPFCPPEFADYLEWMEKKNYSQRQLKQNINGVKRVGYLLANSKEDSRKLAARVTKAKRGQHEVVVTVNDYRYFLDEKPRRENQIATLMTISEKVVASSRREERMSMRDKVLV